MPRSRVYSVAISVLAATAPASADVWMVKASGTLACRTRENAIDSDRLQLPAAAHVLHPGCVTLDAGERLIEQSDVALGFDDYMRVQRRDRSMVFVHSSAVARDPGIGSIEEDRKE